MAAVLHRYPEKAAETIEKAKQITPELNDKSLYLNHVYITNTKLPWKWWLNSKGYFHCIVIRKIRCDDRYEWMQEHFRLTDKNTMVSVSWSLLGTENKEEAIRKFLSMDEEEK